MKSIIAFCICWLPVWATAQVYQVKQDDGSVLFTNVYMPSATPVKIKPVTTMPAPKVDTPAAQVKSALKPSSQVLPTPVSTNYELKFLSPVAAQAVLSSDKLLTVNVRVTPSPQASERMQIYLNNTLLAAGANAVVQIDKLAAGRYVLRADVLSVKDEAIASQSTEFFVLQPAGAPTR